MPIARFGGDSYKKCILRTDKGAAVGQDVSHTTASLERRKLCLQKPFQLLWGKGWGN